jgi:hypothetical protein
MITNGKNRVSLGRAAAAIMFTRNNNKQIQARNGRQASTQPVTTQPSCVAVVKLAFGVVGVLVASLLLAASAHAEAPFWSVRPVWAPAHIAPGGSGELIVTATNLGDAPIVASSATPIKLSAVLPTGVTVNSIEDNEYTQFVGRAIEDPFLFNSAVPAEPIWHCDQASLSCESTATTEQTWPTGSNGYIFPYESTEMVIGITVPESAGSGLKVQMSASGGGTVGSDEAEVPVSSAPVGFGVERFEQVPYNEDGSIDTQAGSHPFQYTTTLGLNLGYKQEAKNRPPLPYLIAAPKDFNFQLPPGLVGDPTIMPQCKLEQFQTGAEGPSHCPSGTAVGVASVWLVFFDTEYQYPQPIELVEPVYNLVPSPGEPARFGFVVATGLGASVPVFLDTSVRTGGDYGVTVTIHNVPQVLSNLGAQLSLWGVPADPRHNAERGRCLTTEEEEGTQCTSNGETGPQAAFLTLPPSCTGLSNPLTGTMQADSWAQPNVKVGAEYALHDSVGSPLGLDGCNRLGFEPSIKVFPDGRAASTPTGLTVDVHQSQQRALNPNGLSAADVKNITVALPAGVVLNPAAADGLQACSESQVGYLPGESSAGNLHFTPERGEPFCPDASKVGTVTIHTPLLSNPLTGSVYLASQNANPFGSLIAMYIVAQDPVSGVLVKLPGEVSLNGATGQITATFENSPQLPFEDAELHFFGGDRAPLATPAHCGAYTTTASFAPWSETPTVPGTSEFDITSGANGGACPGPSLPFGPSFAAGMTNINAGAFSPLVTTIGREDGQQNINQVTLHMPAGVSGVLTGVPLCPEAQANAGTCSQASLIGHTTVSVGLGGDPYSVVGGEVFLTEKVAGSPADAPFGLSIVNPAVAGPFNLGKVVVRATIAVDPHTAQLTVTTGEIPHILDGIPLQIKHINVTIDRNSFTFNPTDCNPQSVTGSVGSVEGASSSVSVPFQVTNCAALKFAPKFAVSAGGKTTKAGGASLHVKLTYPTGTGYANVKAAKVDLPKQLPSRLTTLQKACVAKVFEANPAGCPKESIVGTAKAETPILPVPLEGPAYFVSHGGEAFPSLIVVLQGYGVTVDLVGTTFISKAGITSSTFKTVPDVPVGSFELTLPTGKYSALAANLPVKAKGSFCATKLAMPTAFVAQNGTEIHESTAIGVTGCPKAKKAKTKKKHSATKKANKKK